MQASKKSTTILGIETSCDETAAAIVTDGRIVKTGGKELAFELEENGYAKYMGAA